MEVDSVDSAEVERSDIDADTEVWMIENSEVEVVTELIVSG